MNDTLQTNNDFRSLFDLCRLGTNMAAPAAYRIIDMILPKVKHFLQKFCTMYYENMHGYRTSIFVCFCATDISKLTLIVQE